MNECPLFKFPEEDIEKLNKLPDEQMRNIKDQV